jgi:CRP-like cAMP-binding protein
MDFMCVLGVGAMFGELALLYRQKRLATCIALDSAEMGSMNKKDFDRIFFILQRHEDEQKKAFIQRELVKDKELSSIATLIGINFTKKLFQKGKALFKEGDTPQKLYLIYSGQVKLFVEDMRLEGGQPGQDWERAGTGRLMKGWNKEGLMKGWNKEGMRGVRRSRDLVIVGAGQMLGEEGLFTNEKRRYAAVVESEAIIYEIDNTRMTVLCEDNLHVKNLMLKKIELKLAQLNSLTHNAKELGDRLREKMLRFDQSSNYKMSLKISRKEIQKDISGFKEIGEPKSEKSLIDLLYRTKIIGSDQPEIYKRLEQIEFIGLVTENPKTLQRQIVEERETSKKLIRQRPMTGGSMSQKTLLKVIMKPKEKSLDDQQSESTSVRYRPPPHRNTISSASFRVQKTPFKNVQISHRKSVSELGRLFSGKSITVKQRELPAKREVSSARDWLSREASTPEVTGHKRLNSCDVTSHRGPKMILECSKLLNLENLARSIANPRKHK